LKPLDFPLLSDENIHPDVVSALIAQGRDVRTVRDEELLGHGGLEIIRRAHASGRAVLTHDADFGMLAVQAGEPFTGIIYRDLGTSARRS
jgi:predicted nuclease of predicted toxin-antitoxin system